MNSFSKKWMLTIIVTAIYFTTFGMEISKDTSSHFSVKDTSNKMLREKQWLEPRKLDHIENVILRNDIPVMKKIFETEKISPNIYPKQKLMPLFWRIQSKEMAQLFISQGLNLNQPDSFSPNVLWRLFAEPRPNTELIKFYLERKEIDLYAKNYCGECILHCLARPPISSLTIEQVNIIKLLCKECPELINSLDDEGKTPLDIGYKIPRPNPYFNDLLRKYGGKTSKQLAEEHL